MALDGTLLLLGQPSKRETEPNVLYAIPLGAIDHRAIYVMGVGGSADITGWGLQGSLNGTHWFDINEVNLKAGQVKDIFTQYPPPFVRMVWSGAARPNYYQFCLV